MAKTLVDTETKTAEGLDAAYETTKRGRSWKFWVIAPVALALVAGGAFLAVRRVLGDSEK